MIDEVRQFSNHRKTVSDSQTGIELATSWWPVKRSNHWVTDTQMASLCASLTYLHDMQIMILSRYSFKIWELGDIVDRCWLMIDECSSSPNLRKTISEPQSTWARHLSSGSSMVKASHWSTEGCGFDNCLGLRKRFYEIGTWRTFFDHLTYLRGLISFIIKNILKGIQNLTDTQEAHKEMK